MLVVEMLRALDKAGGIILGAADQATQRVILKGLGIDDRAVALLIAQLAQSAIGGVKILNIVSGIIIHYFFQPVKCIVGICNRISVAVGHAAHQTAAGTGFFAAHIRILVACQRDRADLDGGTLPPEIVGEVVVLVLLRSAAEGLRTGDGSVSFGFVVLSRQRTVPCLIREASVPHPV